MSGVEPFPGLSEMKVETRYKHHDFPGIDNIVCGEMIQKCWNQDYRCANELVDELMELGK